MRHILLLLLLAATAHAQTFTTGPLVQVSTTNLFAGCVAGNGFALNSEVEPRLAVNPTNPANLIGIWQQDRFPDGGARGNVVGVSTNGGATWQSLQTPGISVCDGGAFERATDPWVSFGPDGTAHLIVLAFNPDDGAAFGANAILASRSTDGGFTWSAPVTLISTNDPFVFNDKETITADPTDPNFVYAVWDQLRPFKEPGVDFTGPTLFARSTDGGVTWEEPRAIHKARRFQQTLGNEIVVRADGVLFNLAVGIRNRKAGKARHSVLMQTSFDKGVTWSKPRRVIRTQPHSAFDPQGVGVFDPHPQNRAPLRTGDVLPAFAVDPTSGTLYAAWQDSRFSGNGFDEIAFAQSVTGRKWTKPVKINQTPTQGPGPNRQAFNPSIAVAGGVVCVTYYDFRNNNRNVTPPLSTDVWAVFAAVGATTNWTGEVRLSDVSFDYRQAPEAGGFFLGDYQGLAAAGDDFVALFAQTHNADPGSIFMRRLMPVP